MTYQYVVGFPNFREPVQCTRDAAGYIIIIAIFPNTNELITGAFKDENPSIESRSFTQADGSLVPGSRFPSRCTRPPSG
jgi:hypothetical protein